jgi:N utilization substance protein B
LSPALKIDRHQSRILAMQSLAQLDVQGDAFLDELEAFLATGPGDGRTQAYAATLAREGWTRRRELDERVGGVAEHWAVERMSPVERNILRVTLVELDLGEVPPKVALDEAIEISKEYGSEESARFVNGLLDALYRQPREESHDGAV